MVQEKFSHDLNFFHWDIKKVRMAHENFIFVLRNVQWQMAKTLFAQTVSAEIMSL